MQKEDALTQLGWLLYYNDRNSQLWKKKKRKKTRYRS